MDYFYQENYSRDQIGVIIMDLQLPQQSAPITTSCELEPCSWRGVLDTTLCDKVCQ